jgi:hypothetical protein
MSSVPAIFNNGSPYFPRMSWFLGQGLHINNYICHISRHIFRDKALYYAQRLGVLSSKRLEIQIKCIFVNSSYISENLIYAVLKKKSCFNVYNNTQDKNVRQKKNREMNIKIIAVLLHFQNLSTNSNWLPSFAVCKCAALWR